MSLPSKDLEKFINEKIDEVMDRTRAEILSTIPVDVDPHGELLVLQERAKSDDNWAHQSDGMRCRTCMYYVEKAKTLGRCRRLAPSMKGWPAVYETDWCGDHKLDETKL